MAKIKLTKTELKAQSDALKRYLRFLPMLQLKKQQLQAEIAAISQKIDETSARERSEMAAVEPWAGLFASAAEEDLSEFAKAGPAETEVANIAGVAIPVFKSVEIATRAIDPWLDPAWMDDAAAALKRILAIRSERKVLQQQKKLVEEELTSTSQRVNLFEKVKIPECRENIRIIKISIGDEQTSAVTRGKIAKGRAPAKEDAA